ncbi:antibiotic biosynthesis monooxygenase [Aetokthonos hydrillicola Thurmond2011]|jgi:quinol monooxygenase YgiN|uniref:Antibiotic biosynthesis monooxygenase n=1 Tax=Aetokthonos hydrillicola Thurmond2011 TaxID=2712845 RepID=A0AAP5I2V7_9CYAN|nr:putative quinol monooxygenase [Aetokthonos hydrillicola]MBO3457481.1 antibiotic biosynthesis monooxygenase [Aetokthonos hydrillicola CCALA 1050]MBW4585997.1 antibiotic biosynthesis monooxygenase [Aetokthonos hydrillicola CCALA 1050]MDR9893774.1 antibiotic biosynthesis monooxygenase [Aetokthonos hydrillicola Thurmond2011]
MTVQQVIVTASIKVKSGMEERFKEEYLPIVNLTLAEEGCLNYNLYQSQANPSIFMLYEKWMSKEILDQHLQMPYMKAISEKASEFLVEPVEINLWEHIDFVP